MKKFAFGQQVDGEAEELASLRAQVVQMAARIEELEQLADSDSLTPLPNRRPFLRELQRLIHRARRFGTKSVIMFVDVDALKTINDLHGHGAGDAALIHVARLLLKQVRETDHVARIGGDEFGLLLEAVDEAAGRRKALQIQELIRETPLDFGGERIVAHASVGLAPIMPNDDCETALARADAAMYAERRRQLRSER